MDELGTVAAEGHACRVDQLPAIEFLSLMLISRECDRREGILMRQGKGWILEAGMGHEATAALAYHLLPDDYLFAYCRDRPLYLGCGISPEDIARDFLARAGSTTGGRLMPQHCSVRELNIFPGVTAMGAECLPAAGTAWGLKKAGKPNVTLCSVGDASSRQGEFYEALCFAVQEKLPIVFLLEDNGFGISTPTESMLPFRLDVFHPEIALKVNGRDVEEVFKRGSEVIDKARRGEGPAVLWCILDRLGSHTSADDHRVYRSAEEIAEMEARDPIELFAEKLIARGELSRTNWQQMRDDVAASVDRIYRQVEQEPVPDPAGVLEHLYGPIVESPALTVEVAGETSRLSPSGRTTTMAEAINLVLHAGMEQNPRMLCFGQDIEDPKGGVFGLTQGLSDRFPGRVENSPLAEATIVGTAVGLAATGYLPVFEVQFIDYITPGFHQLVTQIATLRWRSCGTWTCPLVLYAPYGAYLPGGGQWHSQSNDGWWAHIPGLRVAIPSTPEDAAGLFWAAFHDQDPSLILLPKHLLRARAPAPQWSPVPFGRAALRRSGSDVTVVSWGNCLELAEEAARQLEPRGVSLEILDLRTLVPCDWQAIKASLAKTGRLVVVHEDNRTCGFGQAVIAEMTASRDSFELFFAPPQLVARPDVHIPYHPVLEYAVLPNVEQIVEAVRRTLEDI